MTEQNFGLQQFILHPDPEGLKATSLAGAAPMISK